jgi:dihydrofolate reductase
VPDVTLTSESPARLMVALEARGIQRLWLVGGGNLAASCRAQGLITAYIITVIPVILGAGIPLFAAPGPTEPLTLVTSVPYPNGLVQLHYEQKRR